LGVAINEEHFEVSGGKGCGQIYSCGGLSDPALLVCNSNDPTHGSSGKVSEQL
jgi:hypothetical protein